MLVGSAELSSSSVELDDAVEDGFGEEVEPLELEPLLEPDGSYLLALLAKSEPSVVLLVDGYEIFDGSPSEVYAVHLPSSNWVSQ